MAGADKASGTSRTRQVVAGAVGNLVEWYDWLAYSYFATFFTEQFFPSEDKTASLLSTFAVFAVGFFMRPVGGLLLGAFSDRFGRRSGLVVTILLMAGGSLLIAVAPTYAQVGVLAPILLLIARLMQGLSVGGEFAASATFLTEAAPPNRRGLVGSLQYATTTLGVLLATGLGTLLTSVLTEPQMNSWGWRIAFGVGALLGVAGLWLRRTAAETDRTPDAQRRTRRPAVTLFREHPRTALVIIGMTIAPTIIYYTWSVYLPTYAHLTTGIDEAEAVPAHTIAVAVFMLLQPLGGMLSDRIGRKPPLLVFALGYVLLAVPMLGWLGDSFTSVLLVGLAGLVLFTGYSAIAPAVMAEQFPAHVRVAGMGGPYSLAVALFGGTAPYLATWLESQGQVELFGWYIAAASLISGMVYLFLPETKDTQLQ